MKKVIGAAGKDPRQGGGNPEERVRPQKSKLQSSQRWESPFQKMMILESLPFHLFKRAVFWKDK